MEETMNKKQLMYDRINKHGEDLKRIFKLDPSIDPVKLCKQLFRLENKAHRLAEDGCNGVIYDTEPQAEEIVKKVCKILNIPYEADRVFFIHLFTSLFICLISLYIQFIYMQVLFLIKLL